MGNGGSASTIRSYRDLVAWQRGFALGVAVFECTKSFPEQERFGLVSQLRRGAVSIASNIAEGYGRGRRGEYSRFLKIARGSLFEVETQLMFAREFGYLGEEQLGALQGRINETARVLSGLIGSVEGDDH